MNYIFKSKVENHQEIKDTLLQQINLIPQNPILDNKQNIFHTDYNLPRAMYREYSSLFIETVTPHLKMVREKLEAEMIEIDAFWFQIYGKNGKHNWHTHPKTNYSNVYFLECPPGFSTQFKGFSETCEEGDILSFPAFLPHCSPTITNDFKKTVIAFNTNIISGI